MAEHFLCKIHHPVVVGICLIQLHKGKFRIVPCIESLVPKHSPYLIYFFKTAHNKTLEIKLQRNTKLDIHIKGIVMGLKGSCSSSSGIRYEHRSLDFHKALIIEESPDLAYYL